MMPWRISSPTETCWLRETSVDPAASPDLVDRDRGRGGDVEGADLAELGDEGGLVAGPQGGRRDPAVLVADHEGDVTREVGRRQGNGVGGELDGDDAVPVGFAAIPVQAVLFTVGIQTLICFFERL